MELSSTRVRMTAPMLFDAALAEVTNGPGCGPLVAQIQRHSGEVAWLARELAAQAGIDPGAPFSAGLLHDIGEVLLLRRDPTGYPELLAAVGDDHHRQLREEKLAYGTDHALLGAEHLLDHRVADEVAAAVADHHDPFADSEPTTIVVAAADELLSEDPDRRHAVRLLEGSSVDVAAVSPSHLRR